MPIVETVNNFEGFSKNLECPVCGRDEWSHLLMNGLYCFHCGTQCRLSEPSCDTGVKARFDSRYTLNVEGAEAIPHTKEHGAIAFGKWLGSSAHGYGLESFYPMAKFVKGFEYDWVPAWKRETETEYLIDLPESRDEATLTEQDAER